jgi:hypothetical protein
MAARERRSRHRMGRRRIDGVRTRFSPPIEDPWNGTFNLRWWRYVNQEREAAAPREISLAKTSVRSAD